jgi:chromosome segregation ATPase
MSFNNSIRTLEMDNDTLQDNLNMYTAELLEIKEKINSIKEKIEQNNQAIKLLESQTERSNNEKN